MQRTTRQAYITASHLAHASRSCATTSGPLARGPLLQSAARLGCVKDEHLHRLEECIDQRVEQGLLTLYLGDFQVTLKGRKRLQAMPPAVQSKRRVSV